MEQGHCAQTVVRGTWECRMVAMPICARRLCAAGVLGAMLSVCGVLCRAPSLTYIV